MNDPGENDHLSATLRRRDWHVAVSLIIAVVIVLVAFVWLLVQIDPFLSDFVSTDDGSPVIVASPTVT
jgi:hypothetical protein